MQRKGSVINEICLLYDRLSDTEKLIADFVMAYQGEIPSLTTREIAARSQTSAATVSRFVRAVFLKWNSVAPEEEKANVSQFFHILDSVAMVRGSVVTEQGTYDITTYSCCANTRTGVYYYKTYDDSRVRAVDMHETDLDGNVLIQR